MDKKKRLKKIESLKEQKEKHKNKINSYSGRKDHLFDYWQKEIERFDAQILEEERKLKGG